MDLDLPLVDGELNQEPKKPRRKRPRTAQIRQDLRKALETAILAPKCKILPLFVRKDGVFSENLYLILKQLNQPQIHSFLKLNTFALKSLNNRSRVFMITGAPDAKPENLKIEFSTKLRARVMDNIAYVDNLPLFCTAERLSRRAAIFGRVVDVYLPPPRKVPQKHAMLRGSLKVNHAGYGFIQFTTSQAVKRFCKRYIANSHLRRHGRKTRRKRIRAISKSQQQLTSQPELEEEQDPNDISPVYESVPCLPEPDDDNLITSNYQQELLSGLESGLESDYEFNVKKFKSVAFNLSNVSSSKEENNEISLTEIKMPTKKKKTRRKRTAIGEAVSLKVLFRGIQVFPYKAYRRLKKEYYRLKRHVRQVYTIKADIRPPNGGESDTSLP
uniref:RRM domain-containing protein n=1 Tax=Panagrolaimus sp. ES5 TaxID=591445 RepID=A0AC34FG88_9BILA